MRKLLPILFAVSAVFHLVISSAIGEKPVLDSSLPFSYTACVPTPSSSLYSSSSTSLGSSSVAIAASSSSSDDERMLKIKSKYAELLRLELIPQKLEFLISLINEGDKVLSTNVIQRFFMWRVLYEGWTVPILAQKCYHIIFEILLTDSSEVAD